MARGYAVLANGGFLVQPYALERIEDIRDGVIFEAQPARVCADCPEPLETTALPVKAGDAGEAADAPARPYYAPRVLSAQNQYLMTSMMKDVIRLGTGRKAKSLGRSDLAGKTGTTNDQRDAWFSGFNPDLVAVAWIGFDSFDPLGRGEVGGRSALGAWMGFMRVALEGVPEREWALPTGVVTARIDPKTGKRAAAGAEGAVFEVFREDRVPDAQEASAAPGSVARGTETLTQELF
jgi:penicillin-binding protein 1A